MVNTVISFLTDFGVADTSVGQCKGVIAAITGKAQVIDITHAVPPYDVATGAWLLANAVPHFPPCAHVAVVDPGVGTTRRPLALECGRGDVLIGPDNGILLAAALNLGGIVGAVELTDQRFWHQPVSHTFHARDLFCPIAAHLVHGVAVHMMGTNIDPDGLVTLPPPLSEENPGGLRTEVRAINEFGSLALAAPGEWLHRVGSPAMVQVAVGGASFEARVVRTFGEASLGEVVLLVDSYGHLCLAMNRASLAASLGIARADRPIVTVRLLAETATPGSTTIQA